ncbi:hypothetical protein [Oceanithermus sp.]
MRKIVIRLVILLVLAPLAHAEGWVSVGIGAPGLFQVGYTQDRTRFSLSVDPLFISEISLKADWSLVRFDVQLPTPWGAKVREEIRFYVGVTGSYFYRPLVLDGRSFDHALGVYAGYGMAEQLSERFRYGLDFGAGLRRPPDALGYLLLMGSSDLGLFMQMAVHLDFAL